MELLRRRQMVVHARCPWADPAPWPVCCARWSPGRGLVARSGSRQGTALVASLIAVRSGCPPVVCNCRNGCGSGRVPQTSGRHLFGEAAAHPGDRPANPGGRPPGKLLNVHVCPYGC